MANFQQPSQSICWSAGQVAAGAAAGAPVSVENGDLSLVRRVSQRFVVMSKGEVIDRGLTPDIDAPKHQAALEF